MKKCSTCQEQKAIECFSKSRASKDGLSPSCKDCSKKTAKEWREKNKWNGVKVESKHCPTCDTIKQASEFNTDKSRPDGLSSQCKACKQKYKSENRDKILAQARIQNKKRAEASKKQVDGRICPQCQTYKTKDEFWKSKHTSDGLYSCCIECKKRLETTEHRKKVRYVCQRNWFVNNKEYATKWCNNWVKERKKRDVAFKVKINVNHAIVAAMRKYSFRNNVTIKLEKIVFDHLPYTADELKAHLESLWEPWMNWDNYGRFDWNRKTWQMDHIIPQSALPFESLDDDNFKKLWSLDNLRPLETLQNIRKGKKMIIDSEKGAACSR